MSGSQAEAKLVTVETRLPSDLHARLAARARENYRSVAAELRLLIAQAVAEESEAA